MLKRRSNGPAPGPNGITYIVYKKIPFCARTIYNIICKCFTSGITPTSFGIAYISLIAKNPDKLDDVSQFRPIACLNVEGKMFWALLARRLILFCGENGYLPGNIQKGFLPGISGCIKHTSMLMAALRDAKRANRTIIITRLYLANAYGSVRHNLIHFALSWVHVPDCVCILISQYYDALYAKVVTSDWTTSVFPFLIGVVQG